MVGDAERTRALAWAGPDVLVEVVAGEAVVVHLGTGRYYAFNPAATRVWQCFEDGATPASIEDAVAAGAPGLVDPVRAMVDAWVAEGLLAVAPLTVVPPPCELVLEPGDVPEVRAFHDLEDLLLVDPIHDVVVGADGFPVVTPPT